MFGSPALPRSAWADLDVLCLTAIHKDLDRRYRSVEMLIRDIDHFLQGEPLEVRADTWRYRAGKFVKRNRILLSATAVFIVLGLIGIAVIVREARVALPRLLFTP